MDGEMINTMKQAALNELEAIWPTIVQARTRLLSGTYSTVSLFKYYKYS